MPPTPSPGPIDVFVHSGPAEPWQVLAALGPLAVLVGALLATLISWRTLRQRTAADALSLTQRTAADALALAQKRESDAGALKQKTEADSKAEWWRRAQWALDSSLSDDPDRAKLGLGIMAGLAANPPGPDEVRIITVAWEDPLQVAEEGVIEYEDAADDEDIRNSPEFLIGRLRAADEVDDDPKPGDNG